MYLNFLFLVLRRSLIRLSTSCWNHVLWSSNNLPFPLPHAPSSTSPASNNLPFPPPPTPCTVFHITSKQQSALLPTACTVFHITSKQQSALPPSPYPMHPLPHHQQGTICPSPTPMHPLSHHQEGTMLYICLTILVACPQESPEPIPPTEERDMLSFASTIKSKQEKERKLSLPAAFSR